MGSFPRDCLVKKIIGKFAIKRNGRRRGPRRLHLLGCILHDLGMLRMVRQEKDREGWRTSGNPPTKSINLCSNSVLNLPCSKRIMATPNELQNNFGSLHPISSAPGVIPTKLFCIWSHPNKAVQFGSYSVQSVQPLTNSLSSALLCCSSCLASSNFFSSPVFCFASTKNW